MITFSSNEIKFRLKNKAQVCKWLELFILRAGFASESISVIFCTDTFLLEMNRNYLKHDYFTDIITFDYSDKQQLSGELFISIDRVKENALDRNLPFEEELLRVIAHGVLHLMGFKDKTRKEIENMRKAEDSALQLFKTANTQNLD